MGKMSELADAVSELRRCGEALIGISETLTELFSSPETEEAPRKTEKAIPEPSKLKKLAKDPEAKPLTLEDVRAKLADKSRLGYTADVKALLLKHGAEKLSAIDPAEYPALMKEAEVLGNE